MNDLIKLPIKVHTKVWFHLCESLMKSNTKETLESIFICNQNSITSDEILPEPPTDEEKLCYLSTQRVSFLCFGIFSSLSLITGFLLFSITSPVFYFYIFYIIVIFLFYVISFGVLAVSSNDFKYEGSPIAIEVWPSVDVYLPVCGEPLEILYNTWKYVEQIDYSNINVYVLDDSCSREIEAMASLFGFHYITRADRPALKKAGNLRNAFKQTNGDFFLILDADFVPRPDILKETIPLLVEDETIAILQTPQYFRVSKGQNWLEQGAIAVQELFYRVIQHCRNTYEASICVGTSAIYRRKALESLGGTAPIEHSEDVNTGLSVMKLGYKVKYLPIVLSMGLCPNLLQTFFSQQYRWCMGSLTLMTQRDFWLSSHLTLIQKLCFTSGFIHYITTAIEPFLVPIPSICLLIMFPSQMLWYNIIFVIPSMLFTLCFMRWWSVQKERIGLFSVSYTKHIQHFAHLFAITDLIFGTRMAWVSTGTKNQSSSKTRLLNALRLMFGWELFVMTLTIVLSVYRIIQGYDFYNFCIIIIQSFTTLMMTVNTLLYFVVS